MTSPDDVVAEVVEAACGSPLAAKARITEGFSNEVYEATTQDSQQVIVRIHWYQRQPHFEAERWALGQCAAHGIPAPRFLRLEHRPVGDEIHSVCVESRLPGATLSSLMCTGQLSPEVAHPLVADAGQLLARIHAIPTTGYGRIDGTGVGVTTSPHFAPRPETYRGADRLGIPTADVAAAVDLIQGGVDPWSGSPCLLHGDLSPQHILVDVDRGVVSGFIDFEFPASGDPAHDLAYWGYHQRESLPVQWLLEGYARDVPPDPGLVRRIQLRRLQLSLELAAYHGVRDDQDPGFLAFIRASFLRDLAVSRAS